MAKYDPNNHHRRTIRLPEYDYSTNGLYFITICTERRVHLFGDIVGEEMVCNPVGEMIKETWCNLPQKYPCLLLYSYVVMPNHFHAIFGLMNDEKATVVTVGNIVGAFKSISTVNYCKAVNEKGWPPFNKRLWQYNYYEHIIRNEKSFNQITEYIILNPSRWNEDENNLPL